MSTLLPKNPKKSIEFLNEIMNKKALNKLLAQIYLENGAGKTASLANSLKNLGFKFATKAGTTVSVSDLDIPDAKKDLLNKAEKELEKSTNRYLKGEITEVERYTKVIDTWSETTELLTQEVVTNFDKLNPVYMMAFSGARGNLSQVSQLVGMRGLMADAQGQIIDLPIKSNFREGLSVTEYIISSYGARKGLVDTALKTADSGYLTRRLVDVAQDVIIRDADCETDRYITLTSIKEGDKDIVALSQRLLGRTVAEDVKDAEGNLIAAKNTVLNRDLVKLIDVAKLEQVKIRSTFTCELDYGICQKCYGWSLTSNKLVDLGESIGIIAAQSIGEPGTQLTMRTFHTGGVFKGSSSMKKIVAKSDGTIISEIKTRDLRTRHGDEVQVCTKDTTIEIEDVNGKITKYKVPYSATIFNKTGDKVKKGDLISEFEPGAGRGDSSRLTERATKDINTDIGGSVLFDGISADEKRDRQGNISRTTNKNGTIWVLSGDVYNLPGGSKILVKNDQTVKTNDILAETTTVSEHGGEVRLNNKVKYEETTVGDNKIKKIIEGKEITIVIASIQPSNAELETTKKEQIWRVNEDEAYIIKSPVDIMVENGTVIAELIEEENTVTSSGEIRYAGVEVDENQIITKPGNVIFIPEEIHQVSKDASLKLVESGTYVEADTEVIKGLRTHIAGIVEIKEYNDIIHEVIIRPGQLFNIDDVNELKADDGQIVEAGEEIGAGITAEEKSLITFIINENEMEMADIPENEDEESTSQQKATILLRPIQEYKIQPKDVTIEFDTNGNEDINIIPVTQLQYRDGSRVRQLDGACLTRTSLVKHMTGYLSHLKGLVEMDKNNENIKIVVLENLIIRREVEDSSKGSKSALQTELLVEDGQIIEPKTPVSKTQVLARNEAIVSLDESSEEIRRLLLISEDSEETIVLKSKPTVKEGSLIKIDESISDGGETATLSGLVTSVDGKTVKVRAGRPYLVSAGAQIHANNKSLMLRGDLLSTLVFERQKTGDIVQGLPRVEELLEGRKPKESAILAEEDGVAEITYEEDGPRLYIISESGRHEIKVPVDTNIIVNDKQTIKKAQALTDGPLNPHDVVRLGGINAVQQYLLDEVQRVYRSQGVDIADKHVEVIVNQMTKKVKIEDSGDTKMLPGELVELHQVEQINKETVEAGGVACTHSPVLLGITKASLNTDSFISAASFQETTRILTEVAVEGKKDMLRGLKENVIIGRLIPAGTGFHHLTHASEEKDEQYRKAARSAARKPSAILEEIEGMFGSPDLTIE